LALSLSGTGAAPPQHSVTLSWNPSTSAVAGYNVYRGSASGGPYTRVGTATISSPGYTDDTVQAGSSYYYVVTAVNDSGSESSYSNQVQAVIPTP
jgi:fibronectin type 3 domain-containing protein